MVLLIGIFTAAHAVEIKNQPTEHILVSDCWDSLSDPHYSPFVKLKKNNISFIQPPLIRSLIPLYIYLPLPVQTRGEGRVFRPYATSVCEERQTPGLICETCFRVASCVRIDDKWLTIPVAECDNDAGMFCNVRQGGCSDLAGESVPADNIQVW